MSGAWGAPVMYGMDQESIGIQLGSTATDFVLVVMHDKGVDAILNGKMKLGADAAAAAGPTAAQASGYNAGDMKSSDVLTYSRAKGLFPGVSLSGACLGAATNAPTTLYGTRVAPRAMSA